MGAVLCVALYILLNRTTFGFAARVTGGNVRAARAQGIAYALGVLATFLAGTRERMTERMESTGMKWCGTYTESSGRLRKNASASGFAIASMLRTGRP